MVIMSAAGTIRAHAAALLRDLKARNLEWKVPLIILIVIAGCWIFIALADEVGEGETRAVDQKILLALRSAEDPAVPVGPQWFVSSARDLTALGDAAVLILLIAITGAFLLLERRRRTAAFVVIAAATGQGLSSLLKLYFERPRPVVVPHLTEVTTASFPSGHSTMSAVVFLTLGLLLMRITQRRRTKAFILTVALLLTGLVGFTRVYLGVHYPTDVLGGWIIGLTWALLCWVVFRLFQIERVVDPVHQSDVGD